MIKLVFWLVLVGSGNSTSQSIVPVPFSSFDDCVIAGLQAHNTIQGYYGFNFVCIQQRAADVHDMTVGPYVNLDGFMDGE